MIICYLLHHKIASHCCIYSVCLSYMKLSIQILSINCHRIYFIWEITSVFQRDRNI